ncbi:hypothetical protein Bca4012_037281 [Brassica carinata]
MASTVCCSASFTIRASSGSGSMKYPDPNRKKTVSWWAPLFGIPSEPDYLNIETSSAVAPESNGSGQDPGQKLRRRGCLTEEKARELRKKIAEASTFHEVMYHSAIASRLASDISGRVKD